MPLTLSLDFEDAQYLFHTGLDLALFRDESQAGRFNYAGKTDGNDSMPDLLIAGPDYDQGSLLWCGAAADAVLLKKLLEAEGHTAVLLKDTYAEAADELYVVLTSWNTREGETPLTDAPMVTELVLHGHEEDSIEEFMQGALNAINAVGSVMGEPNVEDHGDHFHIAIIFQAPGVEILNVVTNTSKAIEGSVGYTIIAEA